jgi:flagellar motor protein MotB
MTDLMSGVAVTFLLLAAIFMVQTFAARVSQAKTERQAQEDLDRIKVQDQGAIDFLKALEGQFSNNEALREVVEETIYDPQVDRYLLTLTLDRTVFSFGSAECKLNSTMNAAVGAGLLKAVKAICNGPIAEGHLLAINLEGHTDDRPFFPEASSCGAANSSRCRANPTGAQCAAIGFENNVRLSGARAQSLFFALRRASASDETLAQCLNRWFVVSGRGPVEARGDDDVSRERDRRVVLRVRVRGAQPSTSPGHTPLPGVP